MVNLIQVWTLVHSIFYEFSQIITFKKFHHVAPSHFLILLGISEKCDENTNYKSDKKVAFTANTWPGASPDFWGPLTAHACGNWLWFLSIKASYHHGLSGHVHTFIWFLCAFSQIYWIYPVWEMSRKHNAWLAICHFSGLVLTLIHTGIMGPGPFSLWGIP